MHPLARHHRRHTHLTIYSLSPSPPLPDPSLSFLVVPVKFRVRGVRLFVRLSGLAHRVACAARTAELDAAANQPAAAARPTTHSRDTGTRRACRTRHTTRAGEHATLERERRRVSCELHTPSAPPPLLVCACVGCWERRAHRHAAGRIWCAAIRARRRRPAAASPPLENARGGVRHHVGRTEVSPAHGGVHDNQLARGPDWWRTQRGRPRTRRPSPTRHAHRHRRSRRGVAAHERLA